MLARFGTRAAIFPYSGRRGAASIKKVGDIPDVRDIDLPDRFSVREIAQDLSTRLADDLENGNVIAAYRASTRAFDNAIAGAPLALQVDIDTPRHEASAEENRLVDLAARMSPIYRELRDIAARLFGIDQPVLLDSRAQDDFLRLLNIAPMGWENRWQFFETGAPAVRKLLRDHSRGGKQLELLPRAVFDTEDFRNILLLDDALTRLEEFAPRAARIVELPFFAGLTEKEVAETLGLDAATVRNDWLLGRAWLSRELE